MTRIGLLFLSLALGPLSATALPAHAEDETPLTWSEVNLEAESRFSVGYDAATLPTILLDVEVYAGPSGETELFGDIAAGTQVELLGCENDFCHIRGGGYNGWVYDGADYNTLADH